MWSKCFLSSGWLWLLEDVSHWSKSKDYRKLVWRRRHWSNLGLSTYFSYLLVSPTTSGQVNRLQFHLLPLWLLIIDRSFKIIRHGLLNWGRCDHSHLPPVPPQLLLYISFVPFMKIMSVLTPPLWQKVVIFISILFIFTSLSWRNICRLPPHLPQKRKTRWQWRAFN